MWKVAALDGAEFLILHGAVEEHCMYACVEGDRLRRSSIVLEEQPGAIVSDAVTRIVDQFAALGIDPECIEWAWEARR
jgi:hypothetical protein